MSKGKSRAEQSRAEQRTKTQQELKGMPAIPAVYQNGAAYLDLWEKVKSARSNFMKYKITMMASMKAAISKGTIKNQRITLEDSDGVKRTIKYEQAKENIRIEKGKDFERVGP